LAESESGGEERDGNACTVCRSTQNLQVHHVKPLSEGGDEFALSNLTTLCRDCHGRGHRSTRPETPSHPLLVFRETNSDDELLVG
jgi:5-methylcytosine-specific restriction endonuclease McrA